MLARMLQAAAILLSYTKSPKNASRNGGFQTENRNKKSERARGGFQTPGVHLDFERE